MQLFLYEHLAAGGMGPEAPPSWRHEGLAMLRALAEDFSAIPGLQVVTMLDPDAPAPDLGRIRSIRTSDDEVFRSLARESTATLLIAPETDDILWQRSDMVLAAGGKLLGPTPEAIRLTGDKLALAHYFEERGVPTPPILQVLVAQPGGDDITLDFDFPVVLKPRLGAGSQATFAATSTAEWSWAWSEACRELPGEEFLVQRQGIGIPCSQAYLMGPSQTLPLAPMAQSVHLLQGRYRYLGGSGPIQAKEVAPCTQVLQALTRLLPEIRGLRGCVGIDFLLAEQGGSILEINPRPTTSYVGLRALAQENLAEIWWKIHQGHQATPPVWGETQTVHFDSQGRISWDR